MFSIEVLSNRSTDRYYSGSAGKRKIVEYSRVEGRNRELPRINLYELQSDKLGTPDTILSMAYFDTTKSTREGKVVVVCKVEKSAILERKRGSLGMRK